MFVIYICLLTELKQQRLIEICDRFSKKYGYPWEMLPLIYAVLFLVDGDEEKAITKIQEGKSSQEFNINFLIHLSNTVCLIMCDLL